MTETLDQRCERLENEAVQALVAHFHIIDKYEGLIAKVETHCGRATAIMFAFDAGIESVDAIMERHEKAMEEKVEFEKIEHELRTQLHETRVRLEECMKQLNDARSQLPKEGG